jgi:hypothetical protein
MPHIIILKTLTFLYSKINFIPQKKYERNPNPNWGVFAFPMIIYPHTKVTLSLSGSDISCLGKFTSNLNG